MSADPDFAAALVGLLAGGGVAGAAAEELALGAAGFEAGFGGGALPGFPPFIEAPQNGQNSASSSSTDCLQPGHVGSMSVSFKIRDDVGRRSQDNRRCRMAVVELGTVPQIRRTGTLARRVTVKRRARVPVLHV